MREVVTSDRLFGDALVLKLTTVTENIQEGLAMASIARDDPSTLPGDDPFPCARIHRGCNVR